MTSFSTDLSVSALTEEDRPAILGHLLTLSDDDRRARFWRCMPDAAIEAHIATCSFDGPIRFGVRHAGRLVAMVEGFQFAANGETTLELAFSTEAAWRRRGIARALGLAIAEIAARRGIKRLVASCEARNAPMHGLLRTLGAGVVCGEGELVASWALNRPGRPIPPSVPSHPMTAVPQPRVRVRKPSAGFGRGSSVTPSPVASLPRMHVPVSDPMGVALWAPCS